ncbi:hypothetical protein BH10ACT11_BH10ACT11_10470 [soil metagenome]
MFFSGDNLVLIVFQAACVALVGAGLPHWVARFSGRWWALVLPLSVAVVVLAISVVPATASVLTWVALIGVPIGAALALGWAGFGARPILALLAAPALAIAWLAPNEVSGQLAATALIAGSVITLGRLLAGGVPLGWLKAGVYAMAAIDAYLVFSGALEAPNDVLQAASPGGGLPQLQSAAFGTFSTGYGDFFIAAVVGGILAAEHGPRFRVALATIALALLWDQLFLVYNVLPATIPPAVALLGVELLDRLREVLRPRLAART